LIFDAGPSKLMEDGGFDCKLGRSEFVVSLLLLCSVDSDRLKTVITKLANIHSGNHMVRAGHQKNKSLATFVHVKKYHSILGTFDNHEAPKNM